ncbi:zinc finger BED domain-containing protein 4-like [Zophobas morio]|uniref:zinc finger BED domain-containing protein 4-like n=1 Tax=Zophobas morio TaxID=2755281 RepID=UPI00308300A1
MGNGDEKFSFCAVLHKETPVNEGIVALLARPRYGTTINCQVNVYGGAQICYNHSHCPLSKRLMSSNVWKYFVKSPKSSPSSKIGGQCKLCFQHVKTSGNSTNLINHLKRKHPDIDILKSNETLETELTEKRKKPQLDEDNSSVEHDTNVDKLKLTDPCTPNKSLSTASTITLRGTPDGSSYLTSCNIMGGVKAAKITNAIVYMIVKDNYPLMTTEKAGFQYLMNITVPFYKVPGRRAITTLINEKYDVLSDVWTEMLTTTSFLGVTVHFYMNHALHSIHIGVTELQCSHTAYNLTEYLIRICDEWKIDLSKVSAVVTDNGANIVKAVTDLFGKNKHLPCFAHTINLVVTKSLGEEPLKNIIEAVKSIITFFKQSVTANDDFKKMQPADKFLKLIQSVPTRWNSIYYMIERFINVKDYVAPVLLRHRKAPRIVSAEEIDILKELIILLQPFEEVTKEISGQGYVTSSKVIPMVNCVLKKLNTLLPMTSEGILLKHNIIKEMEKRFSKIEEVKLLAISTILDPRFKKIHFDKPTACAQATSDINKCLFEDNGHETETHLPQKIKNTESPSIWIFHEQLIQQNEIPHSSRSSLENNFKYYLTQPVVPFNNDPFQFWENYANITKRLYHQKDCSHWLG